MNHMARYMSQYHEILLFISKKRESIDLFAERMAAVRKKFVYGWRAKGNLDRLDQDH